MPVPEGKFITDDTADGDGLICAGALSAFGDGHDGSGSGTGGYGDPKMPKIDSRKRSQESQREVAFLCIL